MEHSASRALALLRALNSRPVSSVRELSMGTGITKPSVVRLLGILIEDGYVRKAAKSGSYALARKVLELSAGYHDDLTIVDLAAPVLDELTRQHLWPTALGLFERDHMIVRYSTIPNSSLAWYRTTLHLHMDMFKSGMGQAYLAFAPPAMQAVVIEAEQARTGTSSTQLAGRLALVREHGYAIRMPSEEHPTMSLSAPVSENGFAVAAASMTFFGRAMTSNQAVARYLDPLLKSAARITEAIASDRLAVA